MAEIILTPEQQAVVDDRGGTLLVSAAAGSGKTKVLIDRVLKRVREERCNLDDFLMITYTNAAAAELRGKLLIQLSQQLAKQPDDRHLQKQMSRVYLAQISTVHAFCNKLLREYAHQIGLPPDFTMCDEQTVLPLRRKAMEQTLERAYENLDQTPDVAAALDMLGAGRDDGKLPDLIEKVYSGLQCYQDVDKRLEELKASLDFSCIEDAGQTVWGTYLMEEFHGYLQGCERNMRRAYELICATEALSAYEPTFAEDLRLIQGLKKADAWEEIHNTAFAFGSLKAIRKCDEPEKKEQVQKLRNRVKDGIKKYLGKFSVSSAEALEDLKVNAAALKGLLTLTEEYRKAYTGEKRRRHMLDYNDLEHETLRLLVGKDGHPTSAAREISLRYAEIMVDEYQDTNAVQDAIFNAVSKTGRNLFFVGDVKQSIYGFRLADPTIFLGKYKDYADYTKAEQDEPRKILLSDNFRSHPAILSAANDVFRLTMTERVGGLYYGDGEALRAKRTMPELPTPAVELHCIDTGEIVSETPVDRKDIEAEFVAERIAEMLHQKELIPEGEGLRPIQPEDIVILLRSMSGKAPAYLRALERHGIAGVCAEDNLFDAEEIVILTSLLQIIDNPHQDIPLLSVLLSPIFRFSTQTLAFLRAKQRKGDLYDLLKEADEGQAFTETLSELRDAVQNLSLRELLEEIDERLFFRSIFGTMENGGQRVSHLERFFSFADSYENAGNYGLSGFLRYIEAMRQKGTGGETAQTKGAVRLMTIHKSKGLEFPVVFLADLAKEFNLKDASDTILVDDRLGIASKVYDTKRRLTYPTIASQAIAHRKRSVSISEEMRVLYVAMTRAQYRMVMTCCSSRLEGKLKSFARDLTTDVDESLIEGASSLADWILMTALTRTEAGELFAVAGSCDISHVSEYPWRIAYHEGIAYVTGKGEREAEQKREERELLPYLVQSYPHEAATAAPAKLTATQLKGRALDEEIAEETTPCLPELHFPKPCFEPGQKGLTPAQRGTAIHLAMQFIRYDACTDLAGVEAELRRLLSRQFLTPQQAEAVDPRKILSFFRSDIGKRVLEAKDVVREFKFSLMEDAVILDPKLHGEEVLLQGVTDCCIVEENGLTILDFKSDRVSRGGEALRAEHYRGQLDAYSRALSRIFGLPVKERILYFFATDTACSL